MSQLTHFDRNREFSFHENDFKFLASLAYERTGIVLAEHKSDMVYGRLARRLRALGLETFSDYCDLLQSGAGADEIGQLVNAITTNLTSFFREKHHFEHLRDQVLIPWHQHKTKKRLRIWSAACSSGMEPYSIAMVLKDVVKDINAWDARVLATDIDSGMLSVASRGEYPASELDNIPEVYKPYVVRHAGGNRMDVSEALKDVIAFRQLNLLEPWPMRGTFDAIFCRNVVIYFDKPTKQKLFTRLADILVPGGWLYIGHSENLHNISDRFELLGRTIYRKVK
jgi:chemotaxis protein methyltransferase CheR